MSEKLWANLLYNNKMRTQEEIDNFRESIEKLKGSQIDDMAIEKLLQVFTDQTHQREVMSSLIHLVESGDSAIYISRLINATPNMKKDASGWLETLYIRIVNSPKDRIYLKQTLKDIPADISSSIKEFLLQIAGRIEEEEERELSEVFKERINVVLLEE